MSGIHQSADTLVDRVRQLGDEVGLHVDALALLRATAFSEQLETNSNILSRLLVAMEAGTLYRYDVAADAADLAIYDERPAGFAFLAIDVHPADLYIKASATSGDWAGPFSYGTGPAGPAPQ
jgi:hypothetical protein